ncbi:hypothetical protein SGLAU_30745 [Streptomyces glaucescens]|uniref:Uncharacterized protein n=1 Tax=Streptomyces glaucescens TaxID=1907 RepID=A0A089XDL1_STRGA|nr:hypothetical protein SGLAU_30745 [Streptomyces glaucescens]
MTLPDARGLVPAVPHGAPAVDAGPPRTGRFPSSPEAPIGQSGNRRRDPYAR